MYSARLTLAELKASPSSDGLLLYDKSIWSWSTGNFTGQADDIDVVKSDSSALSVGAWTRDITAVVNVLNYIPRVLWSDIRKGVSTTPIAAYANQAYAAKKVGAVYWPKGRYVVEAEIDTQKKKTFGDGLSSTVLVAATDVMPSVIKLTGQQNLIQDLSIVALAPSVRPLAGISCVDSNGSSIKRCGIDNARKQGIVFGTTGNQSETLIENCRIRYAGTMLSSGTGSAAAGATTITVSGANPSTLGVRVGYDFVKVGDTPAVEITEVTANSVSFYPGLPAAVSGAQVSIFQGAGIEIQRNGDNSNIKTKNNTIQDCLLFGIDSSALYGVQSDGDTIEGCRHAVAIGRRIGGNEQQTINASFRGLYSENNQESAAFYHGSSRELVIDNPVVDQIGNYGLDTIRVVDGNTLRSAVINIEGVTGTRRIEVINSRSTPLQSGAQAMFVQNAGQPDFEIVLNTPSVGNGRQIARLFGLPIRIELGDISGKTCTIRASDGAATAVNGVAGDIGVPITGNYKLLFAQYTSNGWHVYGTNSMPTSTPVSSWTPYTPTFAAGAGAIAGMSLDCEYRVADGVCEFIMRVMVTDNGSGSGWIRFSLPVGFAKFDAAYGFNYLSHKGLTALVNKNDGQLYVFDAAGAYPAATGDTLVLHGRYRV